MAVLAVSVGHMVYAVINRHVAKFIGVDPGQTTYVETVLLGIGAPLMMRIYAALLTEEMFRRHGIELIEPEFILALDESDSIKRNARNNCATSATHGTVTATRVIQAVWQSEFKFDGTAMARKSVLRMDLHRRSSATNQVSDIAPIHDVPNSRKGS